MLDALTAAHRAGVLHRDVKPHNVLIGTDGRVVLTDFGLATFVDDGSVTGPGLIVGSPQYVSPERARDGASTVESDLWSFGATLFAAVEGRSPFARDSAMATLMALATEEPDAAGAGRSAGAGADGAAAARADRAAHRRRGRRQLRAIVTAAGMVAPSSRTNERRAASLGRAVVPSPRSAPDDEPAPRPQAQAADTAAEPAGGGLGAALAAALPGVVHPPGPERAAEPDPHPSAPAHPAPSAGSAQVRSRPPSLWPWLASWPLLAAGGVVAGLVLRDDDAQSAPGHGARRRGRGAQRGAEQCGRLQPGRLHQPPPSGLPATPQPGAEKMNGNVGAVHGWS